jgi:hypothetical protein
MYKMARGSLSLLENSKLALHLLDNIRRNKEISFIYIACKDEYEEKNRANFIASLMPTLVHPLQLV